MVVQDGCLVNETIYERTRRIHSTRFVGRRNLHNSAIDAVDKRLKLIIAYNSVLPTETSVQFAIADFNDGHYNNSKKYTVEIQPTVVDVLSIPTPPTYVSKRASLAEMLENPSALLQGHVIFVKGSHAYIPPLLKN